MQARSRFGTLQGKSVSEPLLRVITVEPMASSWYEHTSAVSGGPRTPTRTLASGCQVYDVTRPETFEHLEAWLGEVQMYSPGGGKVVKMLTGNKVDLAEDRAVSTREGEAWARTHGCLFVEASAKSEDNVASCFEEVIARILETPALLAGTAPASARPGIARLDVPKPDAPSPGTGGCC